MVTTFGCALTTMITGPTASPEAVRTLAQRAEALGFDSVWFSDDILIPRQITSFYPYAGDGVPRFDTEKFEVATRSDLSSLLEIKTETSHSEPTAGIGLDLIAEIKNVREFQQCSDFPGSRP